jgi:ABC-type multidrug transport system ATPase subunit
LQEVEAIASRVVFISEGRMKYDGTVQDLAPNAQMLDEKFHELTGAV